MEEHHRITIRQLFSDLVKYIDPDNELRDEMRDGRIFTTQMIEQIDSKPTKSERCRELLTKLPQRGPEAYHVFLEYLRNSGHKFVADKIMKKESDIRKMEGKQQKNTFSVSSDTGTDTAKHCQGASKCDGLKHEEDERVSTEHLDKEKCSPSTEEDGHI